MDRENLRMVWIGVLEGSPLGNVWVAVSERGLAAVEIEVQPEALLENLRRMGFGPPIRDDSRTAQAVREIGEYLAGQRTGFDFPIDWSVLTAFQERALKATFAIPYGQVRTYGEIASQIGKPRAARAVGRAEATNPMPLVIPCHRVVGSDGGLHGYGAGQGLDTKAWLLRLENTLNSTAGGALIRK
ncbi:MAG TPA: methylated-DNA--[protein]-cysteine S-methyltransferase [Anaerolineales bacterium]